MTLMRTAPYPARPVDAEAHTGRHFTSFRDYVEALKGIGEIQEIEPRAGPPKRQQRRDRRVIRPDIVGNAAY
jgi:hypothetical protein